MDGRSRNSLWPTLAFFSTPINVIPTDLIVRVAARFLVGKLASSKLPRQLLDDRIDEAVARLRRVVVEMRVRPDVPGHEWAKELECAIRSLPGGMDTL